MAIPIHNAQGQVVAYCGRYVGDDAPDDEPKYKQPPGFRKDLEIFNLHRAVERIDQFKTFLVFESFFSVMRHHQNAACISFMGRSVSTYQLDLMIERMKAAGFQKAFVVADGDEPGRAGARDMAGALAPNFWTHILDLDDGVNPPSIEPLKSSLKMALLNARPVNGCGKGHMRILGTTGRSREVGCALGQTISIPPTVSEMMGSFR